MPRTRVRWGRVGGLCATVVIVVASLAGRAGAGDPASASAPAPRVIHVVRAGETVWAIARSLVGPEGDPRPMVDALVGANALTDGTVQPGQRLVLPAS